MKKYSPMLAKLGSNSDLNLPNFIYEEKLDGTRAILYNKNKQIQLINRRNNDITHRYPEFNFNIKKDCVLDGEIVIFNKKGISEFNLLQHRDLLKDKTLIEERSKSMPATFVAFDILELEGKSLTKLSQKERFKILKKTLHIDTNKKKISTQLGRVGAKREMEASNNAKIFNKNLQIINSSKKGEKLFKDLTKKGGEGVIAKNQEETYHEGKRLNAWIKIKKSDTIDGIIIGYTQEKRKLSTLLLAAYHSNKTSSGCSEGERSASGRSSISKNKLKYIGKVGTGFSQKEQSEILSQLEKIKTENPAIEELPKSTIFVKPKLIAEAKYLEITKDKKMRAPVFIRIRTDKKLKDCVI